MILKILSYNIHKGLTISNRDSVLEKIRFALRETDADVLFLQEVLGEHSHEKYWIPETNKAIQFEYLADEFWPHFAYGKNAIYSEGHHGNAILSKFPIIDWENITLSQGASETRGMLKARIHIEQLGQDVILANTHLDLTQKGRDEQSEKLVEVLERETEFPWILVGDFNDWNKKISKRLEKRLKMIEVFKSLHGKYPSTFPSFFPLLSLDRIFLHKLKARKAQALMGEVWNRLSDHLPLYAEVDLV